VNLFEWRLCLLPPGRHGLPSDIDANVFVRVVDQPRRPSDLPPGYVWLPFRHVGWLCDTG